MTPGDVADRYFAGVRARDIDAWLALFSDNAIYNLPDGREFIGLEAIRNFQTAVFGAGAPFPTPGNLVVGDRSIAVEIEAALPDGTVRRTANFFQLDGDGRICRLSVYRKG